MSNGYDLPIVSTVRVSAVSPFLSVRDKLIVIAIANSFYRRRGVTGTITATGGVFFVLFVIYQARERGCGRSTDVGGSADEFFLFVSAGCLNYLPV